MMDLPPPKEPLTPVTVLRKVVNLAFMGIMMFFMVVLFLTVLSIWSAQATLTQSTYAINASQLPFVAFEAIPLNGSGNETLSLNYDPLLSGPAAITLDNGSGYATITVNVSAGTPIGLYGPWVNVNAAPFKQFFINITNDSISVANNASLNGSLNGSLNLSGNGSINQSINISNNQSGNGSGNASNQSGNGNAETSLLILALDKATYGLGETPQAIIAATANSSVNVTLCPQASGWVQCLAGLNIIGSLTPMSYPLSPMNKSGTYIVDAVMRKGNLSNHTSTTFTVGNTMAIQVAGDLTRDVNSQTTLTAAASGGIVPYTYNWTLANGTRVNGQTIYPVYPTAGSYVETVSVSDLAGNIATTSVTMSVRQPLSVTAIVTDNETGGRLQDADVIVNGGDFEQYTDGNGEASFTLYHQSYSFRVKKGGYTQFYRYILINDSSSITLSIGAIDPASLPQDSGASTSLSSGTAANELQSSAIALETDNGTIFGNTSAVVSYHTQDSSLTTCNVLFAKQGESWWRTIKASSGVTSATTISAGVANLDEGDYLWKVECTGSGSPMPHAISEQRAFEVNTSVQLVPLEGGGTVTLTGSDGDFATAMDNAQANIDSLGFEAKAAADAIDLTSVMQDAVKRLEWARRDISSLEFRTDLSQSERDAQQRQLEASISDIKANTPVSVEVIASKSYVKYIRDNELQDFLTAYQALPPERKLPSPSISANALFEGNKLAQHALTVSTTAYQVSLITASGTKLPYTIIVKDMRLASDANLSEKIDAKKVAIIEQVPAGLSTSASALNASSFLYNADYSVLSDSGLIQFGLDTKRIAYAIPGSHAPEDTEVINTVLYDPNPARVDNGITGSAIGELVSTLGPNAYLIALAILILLVYLLYVFNLPYHIRMLYSRIFKDKQVHTISVLVNDALDYLDADEVESAELIYREIKLSYEKIKPASKDQVYDDARLLCDRLDDTYLGMLIEKLASAITIANRDKIEETAQKILGTYSRLTTDRQQKEYDKVLDALRKVKPDFTLPKPAASAKGGAA